MPGSADHPSRPLVSWRQHLSRLYAYKIRTLIRLGYRGDPRVQKEIDLMLRISRPDGGCLCDLHEKPNKRLPKSCVRGSAKALLAGKYANRES